VPSGAKHSGEHREHRPAGPAGAEAGNLEAPRVERESSSGPAAASDCPGKQRAKEWAFADNRRGGLDIEAATRQFLPTRTLAAAPFRRAGRGKPEWHWKRTRMNPASTKVLIAEDHPLMRQALMAALQSLPDVQIIGQADTVSALEEQLRRLEPDMLVMDIFLRNQCVLDALRRYLSAHPQVRALTISSHEPALFARFSKKVGAHGFVSKEAPPDEFKKAFLAIARGAEAWPADIQGDGAWQDGRRAHHEKQMESLTLRETEIFKLIGKWKNTEEIADNLGISPKTVEIHRIHLKQKLGFNSAADLLHFAVEWVEMDRRPEQTG
jgi:DNA-binding NarL/FixJ family response regulator